MIWLEECVGCGVCLRVVYVFACFVCDVLRDVVWLVFCNVFVCVGGLSTSLCDEFMMNGVMVSGFVLRCCVFARVGLLCVFCD